MNNLTRTVAIGVLSCAIGSASTIFTLNLDGCTGTCGSPPFATVLLEQTTQTTVVVTETLKVGESFAGTGAGNALAFNVVGAGLVGITDITTGFAIGPAPTKASAFGDFLQSIACIACQGGKDSNLTGPLSFTVTSDTGVTIANFVANGQGYLFASDIVGTNGKTGNVAAAGATPEPVSMALIGSGLVTLALIRRRFRA